MPEKELNEEELAELLGKYTPSQRRIARSTYTRVNAMQFKSIFDKAIASGKVMFIPYSDYPNILPRTLYNKVMDALLWLCDNWDVEVEKQKYKQYKQTVKFKALPDTHSEHDGILLQPTSYVVRPRLEDSASYIPPDQDSSWRSDLMTWLEQAPAGSPPFERKRLMLTEEDIRQLKSEMAELGLAHYVDAQTIRVMK